MSSIRRKKSIIAYWIKNSFIHIGDKCITDSNLLSSGKFNWAFFLLVQTSACISLFIGWEIYHIACNQNLTLHQHAHLCLPARMNGILTNIRSSTYQRKQTAVTCVNYLQWYRIFYHTNVTHFVSCQLMPVNHQGNHCKIRTGGICRGSNQMIILRCTGERAETTFWQFHHALLHSSSS